MCVSERIERDRVGVCGEDGVCVCVCVCVLERERKGGCSKTIAFHLSHPLFYFISFSKKLVQFSSTLFPFQF